MARPEKIEDIETWRTKGETIFTLNPAHILTLPLSIARHLFALADEIDKLRDDPVIEVEPSLDEESWRKNGSMVSINIKKSQKELEKALEQAQKEWDMTESIYKAALKDPSVVENWKRYVVNTWAKNEGLDTIDFGE